MARPVKSRYTRTGPVQRTNTQVCNCKVSSSHRGGRRLVPSGPTRSTPHKCLNQCACGVSGLSDQITRACGFDLANPSANCDCACFCRSLADRTLFSLGRLSKRQKGRQENMLARCTRGALAFVRNQDNSISYKPQCHTAPACLSGALDRETRIEILGSNRERGARAH